MVGIILRMDCKGIERLGDESDAGLVGWLDDRILRIGSGVPRYSPDLTSGNIL
jgi:hypothetical protein